MNKTILFPHLSNLMKRKGIAMRFLFVFVFYMLSTISWAYDFYVDGIYYNINSDDASVSVTNPYTSGGGYSWNIVIPSTVSYDGVTYDVTEIGEKAFYNCPNLSSVEIPNSVICIGNEAFCLCPKINSITIPNSVKSIGNYAFEGCSTLTDVIISDNVESIGRRAFAKCSKLASINIPNSLTKIEYGMFDGCSALVAVDIPNSVTSIGEYAFNACTTLTAINIPNSVNSIGEYAFSGCSKLAAIEFPNNIMSLNDNVFSYCSSIKKIVIPESVNSIGTRAFSGCAALTEIVIPKSVKSIGAAAFSDCSALTEIVIPESVESIGSSAFDGCSKLTSIIIPNCVTKLEVGLFYGCKALTSVQMPDNLTYIADAAFAYCSALETIEIPNSVTFIGNTAFYGCSKLSYIIIPSSVTTIASKAFDSCTSLRSVICLAETPPNNYDAFIYNTYGNGGLTVPASAVAKYKAADSWKKFVNIYSIDNTIKVSVGSDGLTTYCPTLSISSSYDYYIDFTKLEDKIAAYKATIDGNVVNLTRTYKVDSSEGVLLRSLDGGAVDETLTVELIEKAVKTTGSDEEANAFVGVKTDTYLNETDDEGNTNFVLSKQEDGTIGFYKVRDNTLVKAGKAYLPVPIGDVADVKGLTLAFDDATGIIGVPPLQDSEGDDAFYTLSGVRVANPTAKGIYIHNGKKVIIK